MEITQAQVDAISDEFGSTFGLVDKSTLRNIIKHEELSQAEEIIKRHLPGATILFEESTKVGSDRSIYLLRIHSVLSNKD